VIRVEFYEGARQLAGVEALEVEAATLGEALTAAVVRCPALAPRVIDGDRLTTHWRANLNGRTFLVDPAAELQAGDTLILLSALAGG